MQQLSVRRCDSLPFSRLWPGAELSSEWIVGFYRTLPKMVQLRVWWSDDLLSQAQKRPYTLVVVNTFFEVASSTSNRIGPNVDVAGDQSDHRSRTTLAASSDTFGRGVTLSALSPATSRK